MKLQALSASPPKMTKAFRYTLSHSRMHDVDVMLALSSPPVTENLLLMPLLLAVVEGETRSSRRWRQGATRGDEAASQRRAGQRRPAHHGPEERQGLSQRLASRDRSVCDINLTEVSESICSKKFDQARYITNDKKQA